MIEDETIEEEGLEKDQDVQEATNDEDMLQEVLSLDGLDSTLNDKEQDEEKELEDDSKPIMNMTPGGSAT